MLKKIIILHILLFVNSLYAAGGEGRGEIKLYGTEKDKDRESIHGKINIHAKTWMLMGEPVKHAVATWSISQVCMPKGAFSACYDKYDIPESILRKVKIIDIQVRATLVGLNTAGSSYIFLDPGVMGKPTFKGDAPQKSYNTPTSTDWGNTLFFDAYYKSAHPESTAKSFYKQGFSLNRFKISKIEFDLSAVKAYLLERKKKKTIINKKQVNELEEMFDGLESPQSKVNDVFEEDVPSFSSSSLEELLEASEKIDLVFERIPEYTKRNVLEIKGVVKNISSINESNIIFKINGIEQKVFLNQNGSFSNKVVLFNGNNRLDVVYQNLGKTIKRSFVINSSTPPVKARFTLTWDSYDSDMDLHVYGPSGNHCSYTNKSTSNMQLDVDNTKKYGPENISVKINQQSGVYKVYIKHFGGNSGNVTLYVYLDNRLVDTKKSYLSGKEKWHAYNLTIN